MCRETNCIPRRGQSACNYATSHNSDLLPPRGSIVRRPCTDRYRHAVVNGGLVLLESSPFAREETSARANLMSCKRPRVTVGTGAVRRRMCGAPFPRREYPANFLLRTRRGVGVVPTFSNVLFAVHHTVLLSSSACSPLTDR